MNRTKFDAVFPLGSHLCRRPMPSMDELKRDMENLKRHGFNLVKLQTHWMVEYASGMGPLTWAVTKPSTKAVFIVSGSDILHV